MRFCLRVMEIKESRSRRQRMMHVCAPVSAVSALLLSAIRGELTLRAQTAPLGGDQRIDSNEILARTCSIVLPAAPVARNLCGYLYENREQTGHQMNENMKKVNDE